MSELGYDNKPISSAAARMPPAKKTGDTIVDQQALNERKCLIRIVDQLLKEPKFVLPLHAHLLSMNVNDLQKDVDKTKWSGDYKFLSQIPKGWICDFILREARENAVRVVNSQLLAKLEEDDPENIPSLFSFMLQLPLTLGFPRELRDPYVATLTFSRRCAQVGSRLKPFVQNGRLTPGGSLDMRKAGCFTLQFNEGGLCTAIKHILGETVAPAAHVPITRNFALMDNGLDRKAAVVLMPRRDLLHSFFEARTLGDTMWMPNKKCTILRDLALKVQKQVSDQGKEREEAASSNLEVMEPAAKKRATEATERARVCLAKAAAKRQNKRVLSLAEDTTTS